MDRLLPIARVARLLAVTPATVRGWVRAGSFPSPVVLPDGRERWRHSVVMGWLGTLATVAVRLEPRLTPELTPTGASDSGGAANQAGGSDQEVELDPLSWSILHALASEMAWISGAELACLIGEDIDHRSGGFYRSSRRLRGLGFIQTSNTHGYCATETGAAASLRQRDASDSGGAANQAGGSLSNGVD